MPADTFSIRQGFRLRTLVVDDSPAMRLAICRLLEMTPEVEIVGAAGAGAAALDLVERLRPDLVLMDIFMPGMNGLDATVHLRKHFPEVRVIIVTVYDSPEGHMAAKACGAHGFVPKARLHLDLCSEIKRCYAKDPSHAESEEAE